MHSTNADICDILNLPVLDSDLKQLENHLNQFNLFEVLNIETKEKKHSAVIRWLLDANASHGLDKTFLMCFLLKAARLVEVKGIKDIPSHTHVNSWNLRSVNVFNEKGHYDILALAENDGFVCLIENKVHTEEHSNQLTKYFERVKKEYPHLCPFPIFLTLDGKCPKKERDRDHWIPMGYGSVEHLIKRVLIDRGSTINKSVRSFLEQYSRTLGRLIMERVDENTLKALQLYYKHERAVGFIMKCVEDYPKQVSDLVHTAILKYAPDYDLYEGVHSNRHYLRYFSEKLDKICKLNIGKDELDQYDWTPNGRIVWFEYNWKTGNLNMVLGAGPPATLARLFKLAKMHPPFNPKTPQEETPALYHRLYRNEIRNEVLSKCKDDIESTKEKVETAVRNFYKNDYWRLVNTICESYE